MTTRPIAFGATVLDIDGVERSNLEILFDGSRIIYRSLDGAEYQSQKLLGANFLIPPVEAAIIMREYGGSNG